MDDDNEEVANGVRIVEDPQNPIRACDLVDEVFVGRCGIARCIWLVLLSLQIRNVYKAPGRVGPIVRFMPIYKWGSEVKKLEMAAVTNQQVFEYLLWRGFGSVS